MTESLTCQKFFDGENLHGPTNVVIENGYVVGVEPYVGISENYLIAPGFVDLQVNGFQNFHVSLCDAQDLAGLNAALNAQGTTSWLATLITAPLEVLDQQIETISQALLVSQTGCEGIHLEGPFLGGAPGAHNQKWMMAPDIEWIQQLPNDVRLMTVAPEQTGTVSAIASLMNNGCRASLGHTTANKQQFDNAVDAGARLVTHLFNGMSGMHHRDGGVALWSLLNTQVITCIIPDLIHVSRESLSLAFRVKGESNMVLVSDAIGWAHPKLVSEGINTSDGAARMANGTIAGSCISLADGVRNCVLQAEIDLATALRAATSTPADAMGWTHIGRLQPGYRANINILDEQLHVLETLC